MDLSGIGSQLWQMGSHVIIGLKGAVGAALVSLGLSGAPPEQPFDTSNVPDGVRDIVTRKNLRECLERAVTDDGANSNKEFMFKGRLTCEFTPGQVTATFLTASDVHRPESERQGDRMEIQVEHSPVPGPWGTDQGTIHQHWSKSNLNDVGHAFIGDGYTKAQAEAGYGSKFETDAVQGSKEMMREALRRLYP